MTACSVVPGGKLRRVLFCVCVRRVTAHSTGLAVDPHDVFISGYRRYARGFCVLCVVHAYELPRIW